MTDIAQSRRRKKGWPLASLSTALVVFGLLTANLALFAEPSAATVSTKTIEVKQQNVSADQCPEGEPVEWHFVINQINGESNAPPSIEAQFQNAGTVTINLEKFTGGVAHYGVAHYTHYTNGPDTLITAEATIYSAWDGQFNLSHIGCNRYFLKLEKEWDGGTPPGESVTFTVTVDGEETTVTCQGTGTTWTCTPKIPIMPGDEYSVGEEGLPEGWTASSGVGTFTFDPDDLECQKADEPSKKEDLYKFTDVTCTHTVVNRQLPRYEETRYLLRVDKQWDGEEPEGASPTLTLATDGDSVSCTAGQDCPSATIAIEPGDEYSVSETNLPEGWAPDPTTVGTFTFDPDDPEDEDLQCQEEVLTEGDVTVTVVTCTHTVVNRPQRYEIRLVKQWVGGTAPSADDAQGFELTARSGENSVTCTWDGSELVCTPETLTVEWGETFTVEESGLPSGWQNQSGLGEIDPAGLSCEPANLVDISCTHTVVNELVTGPGEEPERTLTLRKQWVGGGQRPASVTLQVTIGGQTTEVTCSGTGTLWTCSPVLDLPAEDNAIVVIAEPNLPAQWEVSGTGTFTVGQLCGTATDCVHTVVNTRERVERPPEGPPGPPPPPGPPSPPASQPGPPASQPGSPSPPVSEAAPVVATPSPSPVTEAAPAVSEPLPQVLPKTGRGEAGSATLWLLAALGSLLVATGTGLELHRRSRRSTRA